ncbi:MAG: Lrp/AsnC family transcriptional regulator [Chloroflexi bacterium]|nr:Lrp/AsnC family transcriptional regulator [Chloroflexota bacterium]
MTKTSSALIDEIDQRILQILQKDGRMRNAQIAQRISLSPPATHARIKRLEEQGLIRGYVALVDRERAGFDLLCFVRVSLEKHQTGVVQSFREAVTQMPEVMECHFITGDFDYLLKVVVRNRQDLERFLMRSLTPLPGVARVYTSVVLSEVKATTELPLA